MRLEKALARLETAIEGKDIHTKNLKKVDTGLIAAREEIYKLRQKNKQVSIRLDSVINQIKKVLRIPGN